MSKRCLVWYVRSIYLSNYPFSVSRFSLQLLYLILLLVKFRERDTPRTIVHDRLDELNTLVFHMQ